MINYLKWIFLFAANDKAIKAVSNKVGVRGEFSYDGEDVEAYYKEDDDYVTASTYVKIK
mgnify:CR=1 FL=1